MELRNLLELLYTAHDRFSSIYLNWLYWYKVDIINMLLKKWSNRHTPGSVRVLEGRFLNNSPLINKISWRVWWQKPSCWRDEYEIIGHGRIIRVIRGDKKWIFDSMRGVVYTNVAPLQGSGYAKKKDAHLQSIEDMLNEIAIISPSFLISSHELQIEDEIRYLDREAIRVHAIYIRGKTICQDKFFWSIADEYEIVVDKERGILLYYAAKFRDQKIAEASVKEVAFDESLSEELFSITVEPSIRVYLVPEKRER